MKTISFLLITLIMIIGISNIDLYGAVGCSLKNPDRDVRRLFPNSTNYKTYFLNLKSKGGTKIKREVEKKLNDKLDNYTEFAVDYAYYKVFKGRKPIGFIFGSNQRGKYGNLQVILATTLDGQIKKIYFQMISAPYAKKLKADNFINQFRGLSLRDFYFAHGQSKNYNPKRDRVSAINSPSSRASADTKNTLRAVKKLLILYDIFWLKNSYNRFYK